MNEEVKKIAAAISGVGQTYLIRKTLEDKESPEKDND